MGLFRPSFLNVLGGTKPKEVVILASTRHMEATLFCHAAPEECHEFADLCSLWPLERTFVIQMVFRGWSAIGAPHMPDLPLSLVRAMMRRGTFPYLGA